MCAVFVRQSVRSRVHRAGIMAVTAAILSVGLTGPGTSAPAAAQDKKPNILFIMGDDIGWMQPKIYHRGLMVGETPTSTASVKKARCLSIMSPCRVAPPDATPSSPACIQ